MRTLITSLLIYFAAAESAFGCSCLPMPPAEKRAQSAMVFVGRVIAVREQGQERWYDFEITEVLKGAAITKTAVRSSGSSAMCGASFQKGTSYLIYADGAADQLSTNLCKGNRDAESAYAKAEIELLRAIK